MIQDDELVAGFERASLKQFHHADHVHLSIVYLMRHGRDEALRRLTNGIQHLAAADGHPEKFHVTLTRAWLELIDAARSVFPDAADAATLVRACPDLLDRMTLYRSYSRELLDSDRARTEWIPPDLRPIGDAITRGPDHKAGVWRHNEQMPSADPIAMFLESAARAQARQVDTAPVTLATADARGRPSARMVLLRGADARGFAFFTNYSSRKARELTENPYAALCFHWPTLEEQIRIEGGVERLPGEESDEYFSGRPRGSQLGAWASDQSQVLPSRATLDQRYQEAERRFDGTAVTRPPFWGGFRLVPARVEFWYGRADRLHERLVYVREHGGWRTEHLYP